MATKTMILVFSFLTLVSFSIVRAQVNPVYQRMVKNGWSYPFKNGFKFLTPAEDDSEFAKSMGYDSATIAELKKTGVRVMGRWKNPEPRNTRLWSMLSDCIVIGTVSRVEYPKWARPLYHRAVYIKVDSFLRNDYDLPKGELAVLQESGPAGHGQYEIDLTEDTLRIGEHALFFLSASQLITLAADNNMTKLYKQLINSHEVWFRLLAKYDIISGQIIKKGKERHLSKAIRSVNSIVNVIETHVPTNR